VTASSARRAFTQEQLREAMVGIEFRVTDAFIDEIPAAYKPIDRVIADAASLVSIRHTLRQIGTVKGDRSGVLGGAGGAGCRGSRPLGDGRARVAAGTFRKSSCECIRFRSSGGSRGIG
jgi:hypothetical protein